MITAQDIVCISSIDWDFIWQGHQEIMARLAARGNRVLFLENTGVRHPTLRDLPRLRQRVRNRWRGIRGFRQERPGLFVYSPVILPFPYSRLARLINRLLLLRPLRRWMRATDFRRPIVWTFLPTQLAGDLMRDLDAELTIYYCIDDLGSSSPSARRIARSEARVFKDADLVFVTSEKLRERASRASDRVYLFPFGVNFGAFDEVRREPGGVPSDLASLPRPIVGYVGGLHRWVDQDLLASVAEGFPEASFVLVGPQQCDLSRLSGCSNVHILGARPHEDVPRYIKGFDVGIVPYRLSEYTMNVYPTKLNEYLAMGIPVVATDLPEIRRFNVQHANVVGVGCDTETFLGAIKTSLVGAPAGEVTHRIAVARENSWETRIEKMSELIQRALAAKRAVERRWEENLGRLYRVGRRRGMWVAGIALASYLLVFHTPLVWMLAEPLRVVGPPRPSEAIVVFAGGVGESGKAGGGYQERVKRAMDLYRDGYAPHVVFSSGYVFAFREAEVMKDIAVANGIPAAAILLETSAVNTYENVTHTHAILSDRGWRSILLVSSPYHMRRALLTWRKVAPDVTVVPTPVEQSQFYTHDSGATLEQIGGIVHEYLAIVSYWWKGWI